MKQLEKEKKKWKLNDKTLIKRGRFEQLNDLLERFELVDVEDTVDNEEDAICPKCGLPYLADVGNLWEGCSKLYDFKCTKIKSKRCIPDLYFCEDCK